jgi:hypothetical protein
MNKCQSLPLITEETVSSIRKSFSNEDFQQSDYYFEDFFEGDGPLGLEFVESYHKIVIKKIATRTVAAETYGLIRGMELVNVNNTDITTKSFHRVISMIRSSWEKNSRVYLKFKKIIIPEVSKILNQNDLLKYYDEFIELGAKSQVDFEYVEYGDLVKMGMNKREINLFRSINPNI